jgi:tetratricopeptide (TPR) repeat protein
MKQARDSGTGGSQSFRGWAVAAALLLAAVVAWFVADRTQDDQKSDASIAAELEEATYVGSAACAECHRDAYEQWQKSQHAIAMQVANEATVLGNFDDATFEYAGITSKFFLRDGKYYVNTDGPDGKLADFEIRHTFGVYPLQQYLIELPRGHVQALSIAWDARTADQGGQRWFHLYPDEKIDHRDELHWSRRQQNWNYMCSDCHSTRVRKNYDAATASYSTTWSEISVGCETCHGPGSVHLKLAQDAKGRRLETSGLTVSLDERAGISWKIDPTTGNATRSAARTSDREIEVCGQCHSRRGQFSDDYRAGEALMDHYLPSLLVDDLYHPDGQQRDEVFNWGSFLSSRMYSKGVTCGDCHDPHTQELRAPGNTVCAQCHLASKYDSQDHHFHPAGTRGAQCTSCHMATADYMVVDPRHDHSFRIPRPDLTVKLGVPNACNGCHRESTAEWSVEQLRQRYPNPKPGFQAFAEAFAAWDRGDSRAAGALIQVVNDTSQSAIARASALARIADRPTQQSVQVADAMLKDPSPLVRRAALEVIEALPPPSRTAAVPLLSDPVRIVRMQAAHALAPLSADALGDNAAAFGKAELEYVAAESRNADRPEHRTNLGGYFAMRGDIARAEVELRAALQLDDRFVPAWANLADLMRQQGREQNAEAVLREGLEAIPGDASLHHSLGLSMVRQQRNEDALRELGKAVAFAPSDPRFGYVYGVALHSAGQVEEAIRALERTLAIAPHDPDILAALANFHAEAGHREQALGFARRLAEDNPESPQAQDLVRSLSQ